MVKAEEADCHCVVCGVCLQDYLPHVQVAASTFGAICRAVGSKAGSLTLQLDLSVSPTKQVTALIQELDPLSKKSLYTSCMYASGISLIHHYV